MCIAGSSYADSLCAEQCFLYLLLIAVCKPGYGLTRDTNNAVICTLCPVGRWSDGQTACNSCPSTNFIFISSRRGNGREESYNSTGHTLRTGATGAEECVPQAQQFGIDIGQTVINSTLYSTVSTGSGWDSRGPTVTQCLATCSTSQCCFARLEYSFGNSGQGVGNQETTCRKADLAVNSDATSPWMTTADLVFVKLVYAQSIAAASINTGDSGLSGAAAAAGGSDEEVKAKAMSSGLYSRCNFGSGWNSNQVGVPIGQPITVSNAASLQDCKSRCDMNSRCWGFTVTGASGSRVCQLRAGEDSRDVRSFFANPTSFSGVLNWY